jgi:hypothetical protein
MPCKKAGVPSRNFAKIGYTFFQSVCMLVAMILFFFSDQLEKKMPKAMRICTNKDFDERNCLAIGFISRMSFVLACFHALIFLITLARNKMAGEIHDGCWGTKFLLVGATYVATFWIDADFFNSYCTLASYVSVVFLIYQALLILVVSFKINNTLVRNYERDEGNCSGYILMLVTFTIFGGNLFWIGLQYTEFKCAKNVLFMTLTAFGALAMYGLVCLRTRPDASVLTSGIAIMYCLYLQWSALSADPNPECNKLTNNGTNDFL